MVSGFHKLDALTRILEAEPFDGVLVFVRTKIVTVELSEKLEARGFLSAPLSGDIAQRQRERTIERLKKSKLNIIVATDVAARGLDVDRISHVINYDIPHDTEAYVHRIGRTGRAGRSGEAILFVSRRETRLLKSLERTTKQALTEMEIPSVKKWIPDFVTAPIYFGIFVPKGVPQEVVDTLTTIWNKSLVADDSLKTYAAQNAMIFDPAAGDAALKKSFPMVQLDAWMKFDKGDAAVDPSTIGIPRP